MNLHFTLPWPPVLYHCVAGCLWRFALGPPQMKEWLPIAHTASWARFSASAASTGRQRSTLLPCGTRTGHGSSLPPQVTCLAPVLVLQLLAWTIRRWLSGVEPFSLRARRIRGSGPTPVQMTALCTCSTFRLGTGARSLRPAGYHHHAKATQLRTSVVETSSSLAARFTARSQQTTKSRRTTVARCSCGVVDMMALRSGHSPRLPRAPTRSCPTPSTPEASSTSQQRRWLASGSSTCPVVLSTRCSASMVGKSRRSCFASTSVPPAEVARHRRGCSS